MPTSVRTQRRLAAAAIVVAVLASIALMFGVTACTTNSAPPVPASYTVTYAGECYAPYEYDEHELDAYGYVGTCTRMAFPSLSMAPAPGTLAAALMLQWTMYDSFYESGWWYDTYYAPLGPRYHVTVISRTTYLGNVSTYQRTYSSQIKTNSAKAKWSGGRTGSYKFPTSNTKATTQTGTTTNRTGSYGSGTDNSRSTTRTGTSTGKTGTTRSGTSGSTGKTGTSRR